MKVVRCLCVVDFVYRWRVVPEGNIMIVTRFFKEKRLQTIKGSRIRELRFFFGKKKISFYFVR